MIAVNPSEAAARIADTFPNAIDEARRDALYLRPELLVEAMTGIRDDAALRFDYLSHVTGVDYLEYFEVIYNLFSISLNQSLVVKTKVAGRQRPTVPSVMTVWRGAEFQEREVYDLMGVHFAGHPDLRRILMWEGFEGHPLRKDYFYENFPRRYGT